MARPSMEAQCARYRDALRYESFASIIPARRPEVKYHVGLHRAKLAVGYVEYERVRGGEIYEMTADGWSLLYRVEYGTPTDELPWKERP
ncbi:hypothetical protein OTB20_08565 [Streptomyces sp. H27-H1]|uniref:hypothetical protein n=1 Tax=Streptomyces sp. H27-H1 TaxID=2996461 RepID=UPI00226ECB87|nr:hypothetical protein [Streptomyces sp. H27-H1]MCY0926258.1 hypothetical protein [Streptomyces sp. H27-H1]